MQPNQKNYSVIFMFLVFFLFSNLAYAEKNEFQRHYSAGNLYFERGSYDKALTEYNAAYASMKDTYLLFLIAQTHHKLEHYKEALAFYEQFAKSEPEREPAIEAKLQRGISATKSALENRRTQSLPTNSDSPTPTQRSDSSDSERNTEREPGLSISSHTGQIFHASVDTAVGVRSCEGAITSRVPCVLSPLPRGPARINVTTSDKKLYSRDITMQYRGYTQVVVRHYDREVLYSGLGIMGVGILQLIALGPIYSARSIDLGQLGVATMALGVSSVLAGSLMAIIDAGLGRVRFKIKNPPERDSIDTTIVPVIILSK